MRRSWPSRWMQAARGASSGSPFAPMSMMWLTCGPQHPLRFAEQEPGRGLKPYVLVRGRLEALLTRALLHDLVALAVEETREGRRIAGIWSGGTFFPIGATEPVSAP